MPSTLPARLFLFFTAIFLQRLTFSSWFAHHTVHAPPPPAIFAYLSCLLLFALLPSLPACDPPPLPVRLPYAMREQRAYYSHLPHHRCPLRTVRHCCAYPAGYAASFALPPRLLFATILLQPHHLRISASPSALRLPLPAGTAFLIPSPVLPFTYFVSPATTTIPYSLPCTMPAGYWIHGDRYRAR